MNPKYFINLKYKVDHMFGNALFFYCESTDGRSEKFLGSNERYIH